MKAHHQTMFAIVIAFAVVAFWRGTWGIMDVYFFPNSAELSMWGSFFLGLAILIGTHYVAKELM